MYTVKVKNEYIYPLSVGGHMLNKGESYQYPKSLGYLIIETQGNGVISLLDIGKNKIGGPSEKTWGVVISYMGEELLYRYEGGGHIEFTVNYLGQITDIKAQGDICSIKLPSFIINN